MLENVSFMLQLDKGKAIVDKNDAAPPQLRRRAITTVMGCTACNFARFAP